MALQPSNISELIANLRATGLAYSNRYEVIVPYPKQYPNQNPQDQKQLCVRCDSVSVPGRSFSTVPYRYYGPARNMPYEPIYSGEMNISVILSEDMRERNFFEIWMDLICSKANYKFGYYDDYVSTLTVTALNKSDQPTYQFVIEEVYPKSIGDIQMGYDKDNDFLRQDITLCFRKYTPVYIGTQAALSSAPPPLLAAETAPSPERAMSQFVNRGGRIHRVSADGQVDGIYDPAYAQSLLRGDGTAP